MKNEKLLLFILAVIQFTHIIDFMIIMPLGAQFMETFDITPRQFSFIVSSYAISAFAFAIISAFFIDQFDRKVALLIIYIGFTIGTLSCAFAPTYLFFLVARSFTGAFGGILGALIFSIIGDTVPYERRSTAMGLVMTAFSAAAVAGVPAGIYLAAEFGWKMPFMVVAGLSALICFLIFFFVPPLKNHLEQKSDSKKPAQIIGNILTDRNQVRALFFTVILSLGHFTIIPFIAPYMQINIGFSDYEITYIYAIGGTLTAFLLPMFGRLSDRFGNTLIFTLSSIFALFSIYAITNLGPVSMAVALCATSSYFIVASGRNVPATTMVTSVVNSESRGSFMSIRSSFSQLALALSSFVAGLIVVEGPDGKLDNFHFVGYIAIGMSVLAIFVARKLRAVS